MAQSFTDMSLIYVQDCSLVWRFPWAVLHIIFNFYLKIHVTCWCILHLRKSISWSSTSHPWDGVHNVMTYHLKWYLFSESCSSNEPIVFLLSLCEIPSRRVIVQWTSIWNEITFFFTLINSHYHFGLLIFGLSQICYVVMSAATLQAYDFFLSFFLKTNFLYPGVFCHIPHQCICLILCQ